MIYLLHGKDSFQAHRALEAIRERLKTPDGLLENNTVVLDGAKLSPLELLHQATTMPFLAPARLVIVEGLLTAIGSQKGSRSRKKADDPLEPWRQLAGQLADRSSMPETTTLVLLEGELDTKNPAFPIFAPIAQTTAFDPIKEKDIGTWVKEELRGRGLKMTDHAVRALVDAVGADLWAMYNELNKLETYAAGETVDEDVVSEIVAQARETKLWDLTDAVTAGQEQKALQALARLLLEGEAAPLLSSMIARQYRQLAVVKEMREGRTSDGEIARAAGVPEWKVGNVAALAGRYAWPDLRGAYALLLDADLSVKRGLQDDESALQLLIHELCSLAPRGAARLAYGR
ncbi:MAG: DNA polymerase III subunit delta [Chloroflexi bacterium]|nr:DNA polymerase III subunit delta [Chloroflexota bacterium]